MSGEASAIALSGAVLLLAVLLLFLLTRWMGKVEGATFIALILLPIVVYALVSGRLAAFSAPGGWGATFRDAAASEIEPTPILQDAEQLGIVEKGGLAQLADIAEGLDPDLPNALMLRTGADFYQADVIANYIRTLQAVGTATYVVFVDAATGGFVGSANADQILAVLNSDATRSGFMQELRTPGPEPFRGSDFLVRESLRPEDTNTVALEKFLSSGASALVVLNEEGEPVGIVDRNRLMTKLMIELATDEE